MKKDGFSIVMGLAVMLLLLGASIRTLSANQASGQNDISPRELIVLLGYSPGAPTPEEVVDAVNFNLPMTSGLGLGNPIHARFGIASRAKGALLEEIKANPDSAIARLERYVVFTYLSPVNLDAIKLALERNPFILNVEENMTVGFSGDSPNDPYYSRQWGISVLNLSAAWNYTKGRAYVGVVDTGLQINHEDLKAWSSMGQYLGGNFRKQFSFDYGWNTDNANESGVGGLYRGHGTHVAGIIAATSWNSFGVAGACPRCSLMVGKIADDKCSMGNSWCTVRGNPSFPTTDTMARAYKGLVERGAQVINHSGFININAQVPSTTPIYDCSNDLGMLCSALAFADSRDITIFASSGNNKWGTINFPARDYRVIAVGGVDSSRAFWDMGSSCSGSSNRNIFCGSNYGAEQALVAPATQIFSTWFQGGTWSGWSTLNPYGCGDGSSYGYCTGTSMSSPYAAAIGGIVRGVNPLLSKSNVKDILTSTTYRDPSWPPSWDDHYGFGIPDAAKAVEATLGTVGGKQMVNRLTPLFSFYSDTAQDHFYTTSPQMALAAINGTLEPQPPSQYGPVSFHAIGAWPAGYPGFPCEFSPCPGAGASVDIFTTEKLPLGGSPLVPLYRMSKTWGTNSHVSHIYTTEVTGIENYHYYGYDLDGVEGYIYQTCTPEPSCIPAGAVKLYRRYNAAREDIAIFPESELPQMNANGYTGTWGNEVIGYVYPNIDTDGDGLIDGFERLIGTCLGVTDTNGDGISDGAFLMDYSFATHSYRNPGACRYISVTPTSQDLGSTTVGSSSADYTITLTHGGTAPEPALFINGISNNNAAEFPITADNCSGHTLNPANGCTILVHFAPAATGASNATLTISSNDPDAPTVYVQLSGSGVNPYVSFTKSQTSTGNGSVQSSPAGISCDASCSSASAQFAYGSLLSFTATPDADSTFGGWSGACTGTGNPCNVTVGVTTSVTATFNRKPPVASFSCMPLTGTVPTYITCTDSSQHVPTSWSWNFGDGTPTSPVQNAAHTYRGTGTFAVSLTVSNLGAGGTQTNTMTRSGYVSISSCGDTDPNPVRLVNSNNSVLATYPTISAAYQAADGNYYRIQSKALIIPETSDLILNLGKDISLEGGYGCGFNYVGGEAVIRHPLEIGSGQVIIGNIGLEN